MFQRAWKMWLFILLEKIKMIFEDSLFSVLRQEGMGLGERAHQREWRKEEEIKKSLRRWDYRWMNSPTTVGLDLPWRAKPQSVTEKQWSKRRAECNARVCCIPTPNLIWVLNHSDLQFSPYQKRDNAFYIEFLQGLNKITCIRQESYNRICLLFL